MTLEEALKLVSKELKLAPEKLVKKTDCIEGETKNMYFMLAENDTYFYFTIPQKKIYYSIDKATGEIKEKKPLIH